MQNFSLVQQAWIPVRTAQGELREIGLLEALTQADQFLRLESQSPLEMAALYRLLLAVLHRAIPEIDNKNRLSWFRNGLPNDKITTYLEQNKDRFDLFGKHPFLQIPNLRDEGYIKHWSELAAELGSGNTTMLFNNAKRENSIEPTYPTTPAQAIRKLLEYQTFALGGLIRKFIPSAPAAPSATGVMTIVQGENLLQTLCLNLLFQDTELWQQDYALWEHDAVSITYLKTDPSEFPRGIVHRYCWLTRSLELLPELEDGQLMVRFVARASGIRLKEEIHIRDPMVTWKAPKDDKSGFRPLGLNTEKAFWRDYAALLPTSEVNKPDQPASVIGSALGLVGEMERTSRPKRGLHVMVLGQANDQGKLEMWRCELHRLPEALITQRDVNSLIAGCLQAAEDTAKALRASTFNLARLLILSTSSRPLKTEDINKLQTSFGAQIAYWSALEREFTWLLEQLNDEYDSQAVKNAWLERIHDTASAAWQYTLRAAGLTTRVHQAAAQAENALMAQLAGLRKQFKVAENTLGAT
jgi:CRISPR system Cascade subunit CasA